jgi:hypothetical protein
MPWVLKITTDNLQCSEEKNSSINRSQQHDRMMASAPSEALKQTYLNQDPSSAGGFELVPWFLKLEYEELKARVEKIEYKVINSKIWTHGSRHKDFFPGVEEAIEFVGKKGKVSSKLMYCWAVGAFQKNRISKEQQAAIFLSIKPKEPSVPAVEKDPVCEDPVVVARNTRDGPRADEYMDLYSQVEVGSGSDDDSVASPSRIRGYDEVDVTDANSIYYGKKGESKYNIEDKFMLFTRFGFLVAKYADECNRVIREMVDEKATIPKSW